jgi:hypothetical protein
MKNKPGPLQDLFTMFEMLEIQPYRKHILQQRYLNVVDNFQIRANRLSVMFYTSRLIVTVGSILVPAFLSIQGSSYQAQLYWTTWFISILITIFNGLITLFKLDKKYYFIHTSLELLKSEGWQYIGLSGRYAPKDAPVPPTHENQFLIFFHMAEKIKMRQVEEEYWKFTDTSGVGNATNQVHMSSLQTPATQQGALAFLPLDQRVAIEGWLDDIKVKSKRSGLIPRSKVIPINTIVTNGGLQSEESPAVLEITNSPGMSMQQQMSAATTPEAALVLSTPEGQEDA